jgi:hypothetical protein
VGPLEAVFPGYCGQCHDCLDKAQTSTLERLFRGMVLCVTCGNKRCPKATNHGNACTDSNEPGQEGSIYGVLPKRSNG